MEAFAVHSAHPVFLSVTLPSSTDRNRVHLVLRDNEGHQGAGELDLTSFSPLPGDPARGAFLREYVQGDSGEAEHQQFGIGLFERLMEAGDTDTGLRQAWEGIRGLAGDRPLDLTVSFGPQTERFAALPLELLHDRAGFLFARPGAALARAFEHMPAAAFGYPAQPRLLFAWACPPGAGDQFDAEPHRRALSALFGDRLQVLPEASPASIRAALDAPGVPFHFLHLLAHGAHSAELGSVALQGPHGGADYVDAQRLADHIRGRGLCLAFLCSCQTAVAGDRTLSGVAQQLLAPSAGNLPAVVATQANLPVAGSAVLAEQFYRLLAEAPHAPGTALAHARVKAYRDGSGAWSVPVYLSRPPRLTFEPALVEAPPDLPPRRETFLERPEQLTDILDRIGVASLRGPRPLPGPHRRPPAPA